MVGSRLFPVFGNDEVCVACDKKVLISGEFSHQRAWGVTTIEGATWRGGEAFREEIYGTNFTLSVSGLPAGKYGVVIGVAEVDFTNAGQRVFDITCGDRVLASNLDIFAAAGGAGKVLLLTNRVDHADDALHGPLTFTFTGRIGPAKLNSFELKDDSGQSIIYVRAADMINVEDSVALKQPVVEGPEIWKDAVAADGRPRQGPRAPDVARGKSPADAQRRPGDSAAGRSRLQLLE